MKNFELNFKFNWERLETTVIRALYNEAKGIEDKVHKFNFLGVLFRCQSLEDYFMLSIGIVINIDEYRKLLDKYNQDEEFLWKHKEFAVTITPHIRINDAWERLKGELLGAKVKINGFTEVLCKVIDDKVTIEIDKNLFTWNLPTNFDPMPNPNSTRVIKTDNEKLILIPHESHSD